MIDAAALRLKKIKVLESLGERIPFIHSVRNNANIFNFFSILRDYFRLKNDFAFLKSKPDQARNKKILIVSYTHFIYQVKLEAMLAKALAIAGCKVTVLTRKHLLWPRKYFELFGIDDFIYFEDYYNMFRNTDCSKDLESFIRKDISFQEAKGWRFKNCRIGQQVLSKMARRMYGTPDLSDKSMRNLFIYYLGKQIKSVHAAERMLDELSPDIVIFNEANDYIYGAIFDLAFSKGLNTIQFVQPIREDALIFKRFTQETKGTHPNSVSKSTFERIKGIHWDEDKEKILEDYFSKCYGGEWFLSQRNLKGTIFKDKNQVVKQLGLDENKKTVVVFSHVLWDANLFYGDDLFEDYEEWFIETVKSACNNPGLNWIIKLHPASLWKKNLDGVTGELREQVLIRQNIGKLPSHVSILSPDTDINTLSLFRLADYGITVRGTTGIELPCFGKPMFTAGTGRYSGLGFTIDSDTKEGYLEKLSKIQGFPPLTREQTLLAKKHAYTVFNLRPWMMRSFKARFSYKKKGRHPLDHNLYPRIYSLKKLSEAGDLKAFSRWVLQEKECDYFNSSV